MEACHNNIDTHHTPWCLVIPTLCCQKYPLRLCQLVPRCALHYWCLLPLNASVREKLINMIICELGPKDGQACCTARCSSVCEFVLAFIVAWSLMQARCEQGQRGRTGLARTA